jgi:hypothetical protein
VVGWLWKAAALWDLRNVPRDHNTLDPHPEDPRSGVSKDGGEAQEPGHLMVGDARKGALLTMRGGAWCLPTLP